jgi:hypothetical protein
MADEKDEANGTKPKAPRKKAAAAKPDPEQLAADIERTREELAETLDAIAEKVSPKRVAKRTTKKVTDAVKDTAHDAAEAVKDTAASAKDKVTGGTTAKTDWAPDPGADAVTAPTLVPDLPPTAGVAAAQTPYVAPVPAYSPSTPLVKPEYIAAGAAVGLLAWLLLRRRK